MSRFSEVTERKPDDDPPRRSRVRGWSLLICAFASIWLFATVAGPWLEKRIPVFNQIVETIEREDINANAYFYTDIKASYDGERYLRNAITLGDPGQSKVTWAFLSAIGLCIALLWLGYRYLPMD
jgi:hypothetical protein